MTLVSDRVADLSLLLASRSEEIAESCAEILEVRRLALGVSLSVSSLESS